MTGVLFARASEHDLFLLLALAFLVFAGAAFWLGRMAVGAALAFLAVVVVVLFYA